MIWLPRTTDNSTYFALSLEIRGIESRLYLFLLTVFQISDDVLFMHIVPQSQAFQFQKVHLLLEATSEHSGKLSQVRLEEKIFITIYYLSIKGQYSLTVNVLKF